jgi:probable HAF family extracellular repeat protein
MKTCRNRLVAAALMLTCVASSSAALDVITLDVPGARSTSASDINQSGEIVGSFVGVDGHQHGFLWSHGSITVLDAPGATSTVASGLNDHGDIVGTYDSSPFASAGFLLRDGVWTTIAGPQGQVFKAADINNRGDIVGTGVVSVAPCAAWMFRDDAFPSCAFAGFPAVISSINDAQDVVGECCESSGPAPVAFVLDKHGDFTLPSVTPPGATKFHSGAGGINARGDIVGFITYFYLSNASQRFTSGFLIDDGDVRFIDVPGASSTSASGINNRGDIVGSYRDADGEHGFLLTVTP